MNEAQIAQSADVQQTENREYSPPEIEDLGTVLSFTGST